MKSKFVWSKLWVAIGVLFFSFFAQANAVDFNSQINYTMGTVSIPVKSLATSTPTNTNTVNPVNISTSTATSCVPVLTSYHKLGDSGEEVKSLQAFLNEYNGAELNKKGFYGPVTEQEIKNFQYTYDIKVTGVQHVKTTETINKIKCGLIAKKDRKVYVHTLSMTNDQTISTYKNIQPAKIYPNTSTIQKNPSFVKKELPVAKNTKVGTTSTTSIETGFMNSLKSDFNKIRDNYKAYLLVFALVLALFWFLRKAATE